jgi:hypothetical protein
MPIVITIFANNQQQADAALERAKQALESGESGEVSKSSESAVNIERERAVLAMEQTRGFLDRNIERASEAEIVAHLRAAAPEVDEVIVWGDDDTGSWTVHAALKGGDEHREVTEQLSQDEQLAYLLASHAGVYQYGEPLCSQDDHTFRLK